VSGFKFEYLKDLHGKRFPRGVRLTLVTILDYANADGENAYPGEERLAADCCVSVRTIQRHIAWLLENGWLIEVKHGRKYGGASVYSVAYGTIPGEANTAAEKPAEASEPCAYAMTHDHHANPAEERTAADAVRSMAGAEWRSTNLEERGRELIHSGKYSHLLHDDVPF
jgi:hypothetical protein